MGKKAKKATKKAKPAKKTSKKAKVLKKAKKPVKKAKKLIEFVPNVSTLVVAMFGFVSCGAITLALLQARRSVANPSEKPLLVGLQMQGAMRRIVIACSVLLGDAST